MATRILIMGASKQQNPKEGVMPAIFRFNSLRWQTLRQLLDGQIPTTRPLRVLAFTPTHGIIAVSQPISKEPNDWNGSTWRKDLPRIHGSYSRILRPMIDPGTEIFISANAIYQLVLNECGLQKDVVQRGASLYAPTTTSSIGVQKLRNWILEKN